MQEDKKNVILYVLSMEAKKHQKMSIRIFVVTLTLLCFSLHAHAQKDSLSTATKLELNKDGRQFPVISPKAPPTDLKKSFIPFEIPSLLDKSRFEKLRKPEVLFSLLDKKKEMNFGREEKFVSRNKEFERKLNKDKPIRKEYLEDQYLGDFKTAAKYVRIICRDHEFVDGDRVRVFVDGEIVAYNILLSAGFKAVEVDLTEGFNKVEFQALNQGSSGPNTAEFKVFDDKGKLIVGNQWNLTTGKKATLIVIKEKE